MLPTPAAKIRQAILHPDPGIRRAALGYFHNARCGDATVMPMVIQAVERYPGPSALSLLKEASGLPQSLVSLDWVMAQLRKPPDLADSRRDDVRYALARILTSSDPKLLVRRQAQIRALKQFPAELRPLVEMAIRLTSATWPDLWRIFLQCGQAKAAAGPITALESDFGVLVHPLLEAIALHPEADTKLVLSLLQGNYEGQDEGVMHALDGELVALGGMMKITQAVPIVMRRMIDWADSDADFGQALIAIGGHTVVGAIAEAWPAPEPDMRMGLGDILGHIHTPRAQAVNVSLLKTERHLDVRMTLASSMLNRFVPESIELAREVLQDKHAEKSNQYHEVEFQLARISTAPL